MPTFPQTTVADAPNAGLPGMEYDTDSCDKDSAVNSEVTASMPFGYMVADGATKRAALLLASQDDGLKGIVMREHASARFYEVSETANAFLPGAEMSLAIAGELWVPVEATVLESDEVHVRVVANGHQVGGFLPAKDGANTLDISGFARWKNGGGTVATGAVLEFDLVNRNLAVKDS